MPQGRFSQVSHQRFLLLEVLQGILTDVELPLRSKWLRVWRVVPGVNVISSQFYNLCKHVTVKGMRSAEVSIIDDKQNEADLNIFDLSLLLMLLFQVLINWS